MIGIYKITNPKGRIYMGQSIDMKTVIQKHVIVHVTIKNKKATILIYSGFFFDFLFIYQVMHFSIWFLKLSIKWCNFFNTFNYFIITFRIFT